METLETGPTVARRFGMKKTDMTDDQWSELRRKMAEGRQESFSKGTFSNAIQAHREECFGVNPAQSDCAAFNDCRLYTLNSRLKRRKHTKTTIRKLVKAECVHCVGTVEDVCMSPNCKLYPVRFGERKPDVEKM